ncbi:MAG: TonB-dependent receptor [Alphaproteobacteria bacterium]|nr:TonB-dependent receptor [Alphaproteobacteria bacterium]
MKFSRTALFHGVSRAALVTSLLLIAQAANAQPTEQSVESVTVTGTNIRGAAPVGSHVATVGQQEIEALAPVSVSGVLASFPQLSNSGTAPQGENSYTFYSPNIHNLAASASNSTLVVVDGMRIPGGGSQWAESDPNIIPVVALQRVEVLADGASSVYGSDAVAGVVNFITRKSFDGIQFDAQAGFSKGMQTDNLDALWGTHWDSGNVYVAASWTYGSELAAADRPQYSRGDYTSLGGNNQNSASCSPASIHPTLPTAGAGGAYWYAGPTGAGFANTQAARPCNLSIYGDLIPQVQRTNIMMKVTQDFFSGRLTVSDTMVYNDLHTFQTTGPGTISNVSVYGPTSGKAGQVNPFYQAPTGAPLTNTEQVSWVNLLTPLPSTRTTEDVFYNRFNASYNINDNWHVDLDWVLGQNNYVSGTYDGFCASCAYLALNGTGLAGGSLTGTDVSGRNVIALNTPLTAANALDVWNAPGTANQTSVQVLHSLSSIQTLTPIYNSTNQARASINGTLFSMPAGDVKVALGGEIYVQHIQKDQVGTIATGPSSSGGSVQRYRYERTTKSGFVEVQMPLVSPEMNIPLVHKLAIDVSGRMDQFSDVGSVAVPKYAIDWDVTDDFKIRGNYSQSFVAPPLLSLGDPNYGYTYQGGASTGGQIDNIPAANFPGIQNIPGAVCTVNGAASTTPASTGCPFITLGNNAGTGGTGGNQGLERQYGGLFVNVKPETGFSWSTGFDYNPSWLEGFHTSVTLFNNTFKGAVNAAHIQQTANVPSLFKFFQVCNNGGGCSAAQVNTFTNTANGAITGALPSGSIYYLWAHDETNFLYLRIQGIDFDASYDFDLGDYGTVHVGDYLTLFTQFKEGYDGANYFSIKGTSGFNGTFSSLEYNTRFNLGWTVGPFSVDTFVNYMPGYHNWNSTSVTPLNANALGVPTAGDKVGSWTTLDLNVAYNFTDGWFGGDQVYVHVNNLFDKDPPFINTTANGAGASSGAAFGFNAFNASPIGRTVGIGMRAKF